MTDTTREAVERLSLMWRKRGRVHPPRFLEDYSATATCAEAIKTADTLDALFAAKEAAEAEAAARVAVALEEAERLASIHSEYSAEEIGFYRCNAQENARAALEARDKRIRDEALREGHPDNAAIDRFAEAMKGKLAKKRGEGRGGWQKCSTDYLSNLLREHVQKGDPVDVGNIAMMLHQNRQRIVPAPTPAPVSVGEAAKDKAAFAVAKEVYNQSEGFWEPSIQQSYRIFEAAFRALADKGEG